MSLIFVSAAMGLYSKFGRSVDLEIALQQDPFDGRTPTMEEALARLEAELAARPENAEGWYMLGSSYLNLARYQEGADALKQVLKYLPEDSPQRTGIMGQYAQALYFAAGNQMTAEVDLQIKQTLQLDPNDITALGLLGINAFEQQQYQQAIDYWLAALPNAQGNAADSLRGGIEKARNALIAAGETVADIEQLAPAKITVSVSLSESLQTKLSPEQVVFIFANPQGQRIPLAAMKLKVADLPTEVVLDDSLSMTPEMRLSNASIVDVSARVSMSGQPQSQPGDWVGMQFSVPVRGQTATLELVIDELVQ